MEGQQARLYLKSKMLTGVTSFTEQPHRITSQETRNAQDEQA
jgi:hypothetical protein